MAYHCVDDAWYVLTWYAVFELRHVVNGLLSRRHMLYELIAACILRQQRAYDVYAMALHDGMA